ncbi:MAG: hypothetical protein ABI193_21320, partial [Minicystis sp.]
TTTTTTTSAGAGTGGSAGSDGEGGTAQGPILVLPTVVDLPYVVAGQGGSALEIEVKNTGDLPIMPLTFILEGDAALSFKGAPTALAPGEKATLTFTFAGAADETILEAALHVSWPGVSAIVPVFAVAGDPDLGMGSWEPIAVAGGVLAGEGLTVDMPKAPYPDGNSPFTDARVQVFLPEGYRDRGEQDMVVHFHGHSTTLEATLVAHRYRQHLYASGANAVLVVPQGPVEAASSDFGKLMNPGGLSALLREVQVLLYREGKIAAPRLGQLALTSHSGGYQAVALNLAPENEAPPVAQVDLFDSLYGYEATYEAFALGGGLFRSNYTAAGGTLDNNQTMAAWLTGKGKPPVEKAGQRAFRDAPAVIYAAASSHNGSTRIDGAYGEQLRWKLPHSRRGPRIELRAAFEKDGVAEVRWLAPADEDVTGFLVETSKDGAAFVSAAKVGSGEDHATFPLASGGVRVRVRPVIPGLPDTLASDVYRLDAKPQILVVDGFDRILDGSYGGLAHDFSALVGESAGRVATVSNEAITEDGFDLSSWPLILWLLGDESTFDHTFSPDEQQIVLDYVDGGGALIVSGSEVGWDLDQSPAGTFFLGHCFGAQLAADDSNSFSVAGKGPLQGLGPFAYGGPTAPYPEDSPDALSPFNGGEVLLQYGNGMGAAVGLPGKAVLVAFPLELMDEPADRAALLKKLVAFVGG